MSGPQAGEDGPGGLVTAAAALAGRGLGRAPVAGAYWVCVSVFCLAVAADTYFGIGVIDAVNAWLVPDLPAARGGGLRLVIVGLLLAIAVHECGHIIGAWLSGRRVQAVAVVPLLIAFQPLRIRPWLRIFQGDIGGFVRTAPLSRPHDARDLAFYGGGVAANAVAWLIAREWSSAHMGAPLAGFAAMFALLNAWLALSNLLPLPMGQGRQSDGQYLLDLIRKRPPTPAQTMARVSAHAIGGVRPRDWPADLVSALEKAPAGARLSGAIPFLLFAWYRDCGERGAARAALDEMLASAPRTVQLKTAFLIHAARWAADAERDPQAARAILALLPERETVSPYLLSGTEALVHLSEGAWSAALEAAAQSRAAAVKGKLALAPDDWEGLDDIERRARAGLSAPVAVASA